MALTLSEQQELTRGDIAPPQDSLITLTHSSGTNYARDFPVDSKQVPPLPEVPTQAEIDANSYFNKMMSAVRQMITSDSKGNTSLWLVMISQIAKEATKAQLVGANQAAWEAFINDHIEMSMMLFAGVTKQEVIAYGNV